MIKAVIFDYGGVIKSPQPLSKIIKGTLDISEEEMGAIKEKRFFVTAQAEKGLISDEQMYQELFNMLKRPMPDNCVELVTDYYDENFSLISETLDLIKELKNKNIKTAVLSNVFKFEGELIKEKGGYDGFDAVVLSYEAGARKPEPEIYALTAKKLGLEPKECIFVDDKKENLAPAQSIGMKTVLFENPEQAVKQIFDIINSER